MSRTSRTRLAAARLASITAATNYHSQAKEQHQCDRLHVSYLQLRVNLNLPPELSGRYLFDPELWIFIPCKLFVKK